MAVELQNEATDLLIPYKDDHSTTNVDTLRRRNKIDDATEDDQLRSKRQTTSQYVDMKKFQLQSQYMNKKQHTQQALIPVQQKTQVQPIDMSHELSTFHFLLDIYLWTAICLFGLSAGQLLGGYFLTYFLDIFLTTWLSLILTHMVLPIYFLIYMRKEGLVLDDDTRRMAIFGVAFVLGVLSGHNLSNRYMGMVTPPAFLLPLFVAINSELLGPKEANNSSMFLGCTVGVVTGIYLLLGLLLNQICFTFLCYVVLLSGWAVIDLQMTVAQINTGTVDPLLVQLRYVISMITIHTLLGFTLGNGKKPAVG